MSIMDQAGAASRERGLPRQVMQLTDATARMSDGYWGDDIDPTVVITGTDMQGARKSASIVFEPHFRAEAAVLIDEISRTGDVTVKGRLQLGTKEFEAKSAESGDAVLDESHNRFNLKRFVSHAIGELRGRTNEDVEDSAIAAHRQKAAVAGR